MGTSNLYDGPKKNILLPSDYLQDENTTDSSSSSDKEGDQNSESQKTDGDETSESSIEKNNQTVGRRSWSSSRSSMRKALNDRSSRNVKRAISTYTKALGGHSRASQQATTIRNTASILYSYFSGSPDVIRQRFENNGITFSERTTREIFNDICKLIAPIPNDIEDSLANIALQEVFAEIATDPNIDLEQLDAFDEHLLLRLVGGLVKNYIFDKLILQSSQTALKHCDKIDDLRDLEKSIKYFIDGIVDSVIPDIINNNLNRSEFNNAIDILFEISYKQMELLK